MKGILRFAQNDKSEGASVKVLSDVGATHAFIRWTSFRTGDTFENAIMKNERLASMIEEMAKVDQAVRSAASGNFSEKNYLVYAIDAGHGFRLHRLIEDYGYPTQELIGEEAMKAFWLLIQHQDFDPKLQEECLEHCDFESKEMAYLTDRVRVNTGKPQRYGTQFTRKDGKLVPQPIEDAAHVDDRRREIGLETMDEYSRRMNG